MAYATVEASNMTDDQVDILTSLLDAINVYSGSESDKGDGDDQPEENKQPTNLISTAATTQPATTPQLLTQIQPLVQQTEPASSQPSGKPLVGYIDALDMRQLNFGGTRSTPAIPEDSSHMQRLEVFSDFSNPSQYIQALMSQQQVTAYLQQQQHNLDPQPQRMDISTPNLG